MPVAASDPGKQYTEESYTGAPVAEVDIGRYTLAAALLRQAAGVYQHARAVYLRQAEEAGAMPVNRCACPLPYDDKYVR